MTSGPGGTWAACGVVAALASGCALTAPALGGAPRGGAYAQVQAAWAISMGPASATLAGPGFGSGTGTLRIDGNGENLAGNQGLAVLGTPIPVTVGARQALGAHADLAATVGWHDSGIELRLGPGPGQGVPSTISAGARAGRLGLVGDHRTYEGRLRFEAYPRLSSPSGSASEMALSLGISAGTFSHFLPLPDNREPSDAPSAPPSVEILRSEVRIEGAIGLGVQSPEGGFTVSLMPWVAVASGTPIASDSTITVTSFDESVGVPRDMLPRVGDFKRSVNGRGIRAGDGRDLVHRPAVEVQIEVRRALRRGTVAPGEPVDAHQLNEGLVAHGGRSIAAARGAGGGVGGVAAPLDSPLSADASRGTTTTSASAGTFEVSCGCSRNRSAPGTNGSGVGANERVSIGRDFASYSSAFLSRALVFKSESGACPTSRISGRAVRWKSPLLANVGRPFTLSSSSSAGGFRPLRQHRLSLALRHRLAPC